MIHTHGREYGKALLEVLENRGIFENLAGDIVCWMSYGDSVKELPPGFRGVARAENCEYAAIRDEGGRYGVFSFTLKFLTLLWAGRSWLISCFEFVAASQSGFPNQSSSNKFSGYVTK